MTCTEPLADNWTPENWVSTSELLFARFYRSLFCANIA